MRADREALELERGQAVVQTRQLRRNAREQLPAARQPVAAEPPVGVVAPRGAIDELPARTDHAAVARLDELERIVRVRDERVLVGMDAVRMQRIGAVERHVRPGGAGVGGEDDAALVRDGFAVEVVAADIDDVGIALRRVDEDVVPALGIAKAAEGPGRIGRVVAGQIREHRCSARDVVAAEEARGVGPVVAFVNVHARLTVRQRGHGDRGARLDHRRVDRRLDLRPRRTGVRRAPDAACVRRRVHDVRVGRIEHDVPDSARRADPGVCEFGRVAGAVGDVGRAVVDERPRGAAVGRLVQAPLGDARNGPGHAGAADGRHPAQRRRGPHVDGVRVARLDRHRADALPRELGLAEQRPRVAAVDRLVEADARHATGTADVRLAGTDVDGVLVRVVRVERHRTGRVDPERTAEIRPLRLGCEQIVRAPHASARGSDPRAAGAGRAGRSCGTA